MPSETNGSPSGQPLLRVMEALGSALDLRRVLYHLVEATVELVDAERAAIFLEEAGRLEPAAVAAKHVDTTLFRTFRAMGAIEIGSSEDLLPTGDEVLVVEDASSSPLVPEAWRHTFAPRSLALTALTANDRRIGILVIDHTTPHDYSSEEVGLLGAIAHGARIALGNAELHERLARTATVQAALLDGMSVIGATHDLDELLDRLAGCVSSVFGRRCGISVLDGGAVPAGRPGLLIPLRTPDSRVGELWLDGDQPASDEMNLLEAFASQAATAIERATMARTLSRRLHRTESLHRLSDFLRAVQGKVRPLSALNEEICLPAGLECSDVAFRRAVFARLLGARTTTSQETELLRSIGRNPEPGPLPQPDGGLGIVIRVGGRPSGLLIIRSTEGPLDQEGLDLARAIAEGLGDLAFKERLREALERAQVQLEASPARHRIAHHLCQAVGRSFRSIGHELELGLSEVEPGEVMDRLVRMRALVTQGLMEAQSARESLAVLTVRRDGLRAALRSLCRSFGTVTNIACTVRIDGPSVKVPLDIEEHLYAIAFETLSTIERDGRASTVAITLTYGIERVALTIRDDGVGLAQRSNGSPAPGIHYGLRTIRERAAAIGAELAVEPARPRGLQIEVKVPTGSGMLGDDVELTVADKVPMGADS